MVSTLTVTMSSTLTGRTAVAPTLTLTKATPASRGNPSALEVRIRVLLSLHLHDLLPFIVIFSFHLFYSESQHHNHPKGG